MQTEDDPLWYDREEPEEGLGPFALVLLGAFITAEFVCKNVTRLYDIVLTGVTLAFRDARG